MSTSIDKITNEYKSDYRTNYDSCSSTVFVPSGCSSCAKSFAPGQIAISSGGDIIAINRYSSSNIAIVLGYLNRKPEAS